MTKSEKYEETKGTDIELSQKDGSAFAVTPRMRGRWDHTKKSSKFIPSLTCGLCPVSKVCPLRGDDDDVCAYDQDLKAYSEIAHIRNKDDLIVMLEEMLAVDIQRWRRGVMVEEASGGWPSKAITTLGRMIESRVRLLAVLQGHISEGPSRTVVNQQAAQLATVAERVTERITERVMVDGEPNRAALMALIKRGPQEIAGIVREEVGVDTGEDDIGPPENA